MAKYLSANKAAGAAGFVVPNFKARTREVNIHALSIEREKYLEYICKKSHCLTKPVASLILLI